MVQQTREDRPTAQATLRMAAASLQVKTHRNRVVHTRDPLTLVDSGRHAENSEIHLANRSRGLYIVAAFSHGLTGVEISEGSSRALADSLGWRVVQAR